VVGREPELAVALATLGCERHLLLEGPAGCGKTTLAREACRRLGFVTVRVDGDDRFSEARLAGWFDPPLVLRMGFGEAAYVPGPLVRAMREGSVLFLNELNRLPEATQNLLLPALDEGVVQVPHLGEVRAGTGFVVVATQNPAEYVAAGHLSEALRDRFEHLELGYQSAAEEEAIVAAATGCRDQLLVRAAVRVTRATRLHPRVRRGASVRGAMAIVDLIGRDLAPAEATADGLAPALLRRAAETALANRVELREAGTRLGEVLDEIMDLVVRRGGDPDTAGAAGAWGAGAEPAAPPAGAGAARAREQRLPARPAEPKACTLSDRRALAVRLRAAPEDLDGWKIAADLSAGALAHAGERAWLCAQQLAVGAVLRRAGRLVGPLKAATRSVSEPLLEPWGGELDVEATVDNLLGKPHPEQGDLIVRRRVDRRHQVVLMVDTSLSMAGEKMALAAVATAVLALKLRPGDLAVELFADDARLVSRFEEEVPPAELVRRMLAVPCGGGTDIAAALRLGHAELHRGRDPGRSGLLVTDGVYTSGANPLPAAARFGPLHVLLMEAQPAVHGAAASGRAPVTTWVSPRLHVGEAIARAADGGLVRVDGFPALPRRMLEVADRVLR
jgi:MoxR-like ATPase/Mg-chelatase subunit ChlD